MATNFEVYKNRLKAGFKREYVSKCLTEAIEETIEVIGEDEYGVWFFIFDGDSDQFEVISSIHDKAVKE